MECFDFFFRICKYSISINPKKIWIERWGVDDFGKYSQIIFRFEIPPKPKITPLPTPPEMDDDDDFDPIPF